MPGIKFFLWIFLLGWLASCSKISPPSPPHLPLPARFARLPYSEPSSACETWWKNFHDPLLNRLIASALKDNYDLQLATERVLQMQAIAAEAGALKWPQISANVSYEKTHTNIILPGMPTGSPTGTNASSTISKSIEYNYYNLSFMASYEVDLWGRIRHSHAAAKWNLLSSRWNRLTVAQTLIAETATKYFQLRYLAKRLQLTRQQLQILQQEVSLSQKRYKQGKLPLLELKQKKLELFRTHSLIPELERQQTLTKQALSILLGRFQEITAQIKPGLPQLPRRLPAALPSDLLKQRPDIKAAEASLFAAHEEYAAALAERFPQITLTASVETASEALKELFSSDSFLWKVAAGSMTPIFKGGRLRAKSRAAKSQFKQAAIKYAQTVLNAFWEVERCLLNEEKLREELSLRLKIYQEAQALEALLQERYLHGLVDLMPVLDARLKSVQAEENLLETRFALLSNRIALYRALGGGTELCNAN